MDMEYWEGGGTSAQKDKFLCGGRSWVKYKAHLKKKLMTGFFSEDRERFQCCKSKTLVQNLELVSKPQLQMGQCYIGIAVFAVCSVYMVVFRLPPDLQKMHCNSSSILEQHIVPYFHLKEFRDVCSGNSKASTSFIWFLSSASALCSKWVLAATTQPRSVLLIWQLLVTI